jgi:CheY-like chemotaxis protein
MGEVLFELGCDVELAPDGPAALALLEERAHGIDLVISDQRMPGMTGVELAEILAVRHPSVRLVLLTAHADREVVERALGAHARNVLRKPVSVMDLRRLVDDVA